MIYPQKCEDIYTDGAKDTAGKTAGTLAWVRLELPNSNSSHCIFHC